MTDVADAVSTKADAARGRPVLLVGSVPLQNPEEVFAMASGELGDRLAAIPDGETGVRKDWLYWQRAAMDDAPFLQPCLVAETYLRGSDRYQVRDGGVPADALFGSLGYADTARESYAVFRRLRDEGRVAPGLRFQVSIPTPLAPVVRFVRPEDVEAVLPAYARAMKREIETICREIPRSDLAIQWDVALEIALLEGVIPGARHPIEQVGRDLAELGGWVPEGVMLGYHFCYGDAGHKHFKEPGDAGLMTRLANAMFAAAQRRVDWIHMPVPRSRDDAAYYAPLADLALPAGCTLYLGLIHLTDGVEGTRNRIAAAEAFVHGFGLATECGWGRRPPETVPEVMALSATLAAA